MSRKDYIIIADAIATARQLAGTESDHIDIVVDELCIALHRDNPAFDRDRFTTACNA